MSALLEVKDLGTWFYTRQGIVKAVDNVDFQVAAGETLAIVGESGCGKSMTALSLMRLIPDPPGRIVSGTVKLGGRELLTLSEEEMRRVRGNEISMIFQEPMTSLNPVMTIGKQISEALILHRDMDRKAALKRAVEMLDLVRIPEPAQRAKEYPHQLSGGMRQRAMIAMALACNPKVLIADEPTTALDVTIQAQILELIVELQREFSAAVILITHDLGVVAETARRVIVMYAGRKVEEAEVGELFARPLHPYTVGLLASIPRLDLLRGEVRNATDRLQEIPGMVPPLFALPTAAPSRRAATGPTISAARAAGLRTGSGEAHWAACCAHSRCGRANQPVLRDQPMTLAKKHFPVKAQGVLRRTVGQVYAVDGISFAIGVGETLGLVGESGCGKTTAGRAVLRLIEPTSGSIEVGGTDITHLSKSDLRPYRRQMQIIFQDPFSSLNPRMTAGDIVGEPLLVHGVANRKERGEQVAALFARVGLRPAQMANYPHQFSGGQRQRIGIARALALGPKLIVGDEPVSALDVSIQAQVINLLQDLQRERQLSYLFISHNLAVVEHISHHIAVMYLGRIVEHADTRSIFTRAQHPYTEALLSAVPVPDPAIRRQKRVLQGDVPSPVKPPSGCHFHTRCPYAIPRCKVESPPLREIAPGHHVSCHLR